MANAQKSTSDKVYPQRYHLKNQGASNSHNVTNCGSYGASSQTKRPSGLSPRVFEKFPALGLEAYNFVAYNNDHAIVARRLTVNYIVYIYLAVHALTINHVSSQLLIERNARESAYANVIEQCLLQPSVDIGFLLKARPLRSSSGSANNAP